MPRRISRWRKVASILRKVLWKQGDVPTPSPRFPQNPIEPEEPASPPEVEAAYQILLGRPPDPQGLAHYTQRAAAGMSLAMLIRELRSSDEYHLRNSPSEPAEGKSQGDDTDLQPEQIIANYSIAELIATAEEYYRRIPDPSPLIAKPFAYWHEAPQMLHDLGLLLSGMRMGKTMTVLDFGAGSCWLSRFLAQLNCRPICCDVSQSALDIGRRLFAELPLVGTAVFEPQFLLFDGHRLELPDESVDRIVCFDTFHHVPNQEEVLREFSRVLRPGGLIGFSEPGRFHSRSPQSQYEMRTHRVLENDIDLTTIVPLAKEAGLGSVRIKALIDCDLSLNEYVAATGRCVRSDSDVGQRLLDSVREVTTSRSVFILSKGPLRLDSRTHDGLAHQIIVEPLQATVSAGEPLRLRFRVRNRGVATWLHENAEIFGVVRLGSHLFSASGVLLNLDNSRQELPYSVCPGDELDIETETVFEAPGEFLVVYDLVAEGVTWFENVGSEPATIRVSVV